MKPPRSAACLHRLSAHCRCSRVEPRPRTAWLKSVPSSFHQIACKNNAFPRAKLARHLRCAALGTGGLSDAGGARLPACELLDGLIGPLPRRMKHVHMKPQSEEKVHELRLGSGLLH